MADKRRRPEDDDQRRTRRPDEQGRDTQQGPPQERQGPPQGQQGPDPDFRRRMATPGRMPPQDGLGTPPFPAGMQVPPDLAAMQMMARGMGGGGLPGAMRLPGGQPGQPDQAGPVGKEEISLAMDTLKRYKSGKSHLEHRVVEDELWWELRHWEAIRKDATFGGQRAADLLDPHPTSAWLFNTLMNKHADAMDNQPEPVILAREQSDEQSAEVLSSVVPVIMENAHFDSTCSLAWWEKLKHGTAVYGVFWDPKKENGLGDVEIRQIDLLNLFWEPGITDIQDSRNLFVCELVDEDLLDQQYPQYSGKMGGDPIDLMKYRYDESIDLTGKSLVVDWYYKAETPSGRTIVHYAKFVGETLLYASENDPALRDRGYYDHGLYPVVLDTLFPEKGTPIGFGYIAIGKDPQMYIDKLFGYLLDHARMAANPRFWVSSSTNVNEEEFLDVSQKLIHVEGELDDRRISQFIMQPASSIYYNIAQMKIDELKETTSNKDVNQGGAGHGVTAAAAIAALQEAGNKVSRDMIGDSYRAHTKMVEMVIELIRQFYDEARAFRIADPNRPGQWQYLMMDNAAMKDQALPPLPGATELLYRRPVFDVKVKAQKTNPFSRMEQNERAKELYSMGFFQPENAQASMGALNMMEFEGIDDVRDYVQQGQTLLNLVQQLTAMVQQLTGQVMPAEEAPPEGGDTGGGSGDRTIDQKSVDAKRSTMTGYGQRLARRASADITQPGARTAPGGGS